MNRNQKAHEEWECNSDDDIKPDELSGDQNEQGSQKVDQSYTKKANLLLTTASIMKVIIGAGVISMPYTFSRLGYIVGIFLIIILICISQFSSTLLIKAKNLSKHSNYPTIFYHISNSKYLKIVPPLIFAFGLTGVAIGQMIILKGTIKYFISNIAKKYGNDWVADQFYLSKWIIVLFLGIFQSPFIGVKKIQKLKYLSFTGATGICLFMVFFLINFFIEISGETINWKCSPDFKPVNDHFLQVISVLPNFMFALGFQSNIFPIYKGLKNPSDSRIVRACLFAVLTCGIFYTIAGITGFCLYGRDVQGNFLQSMDIQKTNMFVYVVLNILIIISVFCSFPLVYFVARNNFISTVKIVINIFRQKNQKKKSVLEEEAQGQLLESNENGQRRESKWFFYALTIPHCLFVMFLGALLDDIATVFNILGAIASSSICLILPSFFYVALIRKYNKPKKTQYYLAMAMFIFFVPFGIFAVFANIFIHA